MRLELSINEAAEMVAKFQFHKGAIRTIEALRELRDKYHFNSIKVRLELIAWYQQNKEKAISIP